MIALKLDRFNQWLSALLLQPRYLVVLRCTAVILMLHGIDEFQWFRVPERLMAAAILLVPQWTEKRWLWLLLSTSLIINNIHFWYLLVNHEFIITYWALVCTLALYAKHPDQVMGWNGKLLIGLCFAFATAWKLISGEYLNGSFLHLTFLLDARLEMGALLFGGLGAETLAANRDLLTTIQTLHPLEGDVLMTTPLMSTLSVVLSYWTLLIEGLVAVAFLAPRGWGWIYPHRDLLLLVFVFTTYAAIPVFSFAAVLLVMGWIQCPSHQVRKLKVYLTAFIFCPLWLSLPQIIFLSLRMAITPLT